MSIYCVWSVEPERNEQILEFSDQAAAVSYFNEHTFGYRVTGLQPAMDMSVWIKVAKKPSDEDLAEMVAPFSIDQVSVLAPGEHPGTYGYWISPCVDVLAPVMVEVDE